MGYILLLISVFAGTLKAYASKRISNDVITLSDNIYVMLIRMIMCTCIGVFGIIFASNKIELKASGIELIICGISGLALTVFVMSWLFAVKKGAFLLVNAFTSASFLIPSLFGMFLLNEQFTMYKVMAVLCICGALVFLLRYNTRIKGKITDAQIALMILISVAQGLNQSMQKLYTHYVPEKDVMIYNLYTFAFATLFLIIFKLFRKAKKEVQNKMRLYVYVYIALMAVALFANTYFLSLAAVTIDAIILYPLSNVLVLVANSIMAHVCFHEKIKRESVIGILFTLAALIFSGI